MTESKKHSLKSVALTIQQHKNEVLHKQLRNSQVNKCNQQWNHLKKWKEKETKAWWKMKTSEEIVMKNPKGFSQKNKSF